MSRGRLETVYTPRTAILIVVALFVLQIAVARMLWLTNDEVVFWALSREWQWHYAGQAPLAFWLSRISTEVFGNNLLGLRMPSLVCFGIVSLGSLRLILKMGWSIGACTTALLFTVTPLFFFDGLLAGPEMPLAAAWIVLMNLSYDRRRPFMFGVASAIALLIHPAAAFGIIPGLTRFANYRHALVLTSLVITATFFLWREPIVTDYAMAAVLCGPGVVCSLLLLTRERGQLKFLKLWMFSGLFALCFDPTIAIVAGIPALIYFAKLSASSARPRLVRFSLISGIALTVIGILVLSEQDAGWRRLNHHLTNLPPPANSLPIVAQNDVLAAHVKFARSKTPVYSIDAKPTLPESYLLLSHQSSKQNQTCETYSMLAKLRFAYCRHINSAQRAIAAEPSTQ